MERQPKKSRKRERREKADVAEGAQRGGDTSSEEDMPAPPPRKKQKGPPLGPFELRPEESIEIGDAARYKITTDEDGEEIKNGKFTEEEHELVEAAVENYLRDNGLDIETDLQDLLEGKIKGHARPWREIGASCCFGGRPALSHLKRFL